MAFDHSLLDDIPNNFKKMIAGNIKINEVINFRTKRYIIDVTWGFRGFLWRKRYE